jgi:putative acetyltransferase
MATIRPERPADAVEVRAVLTAAFPTDAEARLVERLRLRDPYLALVAESNGVVIGYVGFSAVALTEPDHPHRGVGLAPVAVRPDHQRHGIGVALVNAGLDACRRAGWPFAVVLGHPAYYPRFGFRPAAEFGLRNEYGAGDEFMAVELAPGSLPPAGGLVKFGPDFAELS